MVEASLVQDIEGSGPLLFTTLLGPIVLVVLIAFVAYRFFASRYRR